MPHDDTYYYEIFRKISQGIKMPRDTYYISNHKSVMSYFNTEAKRELNKN